MASPVIAQDTSQENDAVGKVTGYAIPRFVSLKSDEANIRRGPAKRFPIDWVYVKPHTPLEIIAEHDVWRKVRDIQGDEGWVHSAMLSGRRTAIVSKHNSIFRKYKEPTSHGKARLEQGVQLMIEKCNPSYCKASIDGVKGWVEKANLWGVYHDEIIE